MNECLFKLTDFLNSQKYLNSPELDSEFSLFNDEGDLEFVRARLRMDNLPEGSTYYILTNNSEVTSSRTLHT